ILDNEILPELVGQRGRQHARELVGRPARGIRHDEGDDAARILLSEARHRDGQSSENRRNHTEDPPHRTLLLRRAFRKAYASGSPGHKTEGGWPWAKARRLQRTKPAAGRSCGSVWVTGPTPFIG